MRIGTLLVVLVPLVMGTDVGYFLQLSDIHLDQLYAPGANATCAHSEDGYPCCRNGTAGIPPLRSAGVFGDYACDSPRTLVEYTIKWLADHLAPATAPATAPDFILWSGDTADHHIFEQSFEYNTNSVNVTTTLLLERFPRTPVFPCIGNHDTWPVDWFCANDTAYADLLRRYGQMWRPWLGADYETFERHGYYSLLIDPGLRLVVLNSLYDDTNNLPAELLEECQEGAQQLAWVRSMLELSRKRGDKVWIMGHIAPGSAEISVDFSVGFQDLVAEYRDVVVEHFWGHAHNDRFFLLRDREGNPVSRGLIPGSIEPDHHDPMFRLYTYNRTDYTVLNYAEYVLDLTALNSGVDHGYQKTYDALSAYDLADMSPASFAELASRLRQNKTLFDIYIRNYAPGVDIQCDDRCRRTLWCDIMYVDPVHYDLCLLPW